MPILNSWQKVFDEPLFHFTVREFRAHFPTRFFPSSIYTPFGSTEEAEELEEIFPVLVLIDKVGEDFFQFLC